VLGACDRLAKIAARFGLTERAQHWRGRAESHPREDPVVRLERGARPLRRRLRRRSPRCEPAVAGRHGFIAATIRAYVATVEAIGRRLRAGTACIATSRRTTFGAPETSFTICTFWYVEALAADRPPRRSARAVRKRARARNPLGLLSEDLGFDDGEAWGNFPQTYSHVGLISAAMRLSRPWQDAT
jgi:GH15 family glucan-1,4-alpha-glucosidase